MTTASRYRSAVLNAVCSSTVPPASSNRALMLFSSVLRNITFFISICAGLHQACVQSRHLLASNDRTMSMQGFVEPSEPPKSPLTACIPIGSKCKRQLVKIPKGAVLQSEAWMRLTGKSYTAETPYVQTSSLMIWQNIVLLSTHLSLGLLINSWATHGLGLA